MGLFRDETSSAILNCSDSDYEKYLELKTIKIEEKQQIDNLKDKVNEISELKTELEELKNMMKDIVDKLGSFDK